jgi:glycosyltransferase involved in cell wall biosynthesis
MKNLHVLGLPNTITCSGNESCPITQKIYNFCSVFHNNTKYRVIHYGHNQSNTPAAEHVSVTSDEVLLAAYGTNNPAAVGSYTDLAHSIFYANTAREVSVRKQPGDILLAFSASVMPVAEQLGRGNDIIVAEPSVNSAEAFSFFRCYESYPLKAAFAGTEGVSKDDPKWYWRVVPPSFAIEKYVSHPKESWAVYVASNPHPWGIAQAIDACGKAGLHLKVCGAVDHEALNLPEPPKHVQYLGEVSEEQKRQLLSKAHCGFLMSLRWEPFGPEVVEMMLSGCVPITTDLGGMTEYIVDGLNGFRCNTLRDMLRAIKKAGNIDQNKMRSFAVVNFSRQAVLPKYERAFEDFANVLDGRGWFDEQELLAGHPLGLDYRALYV